jgi:hypothetical protein
MYLLHRAGGYPLSVLFFGAIGTASVGVIFWLLKKLEVPELVALTLCFAVLMLSLPFWVVRPATFSILLTAVFLASTYLYRREKLNALWHLPPLMVLWANLHGGYVVGLGLIGLLAVCELLDRRWDRAKHVILVGVAGFLLSGINPYTWHLWLYPFTYFVGDNASIALISEWQSPPFFHYLGTVPLGLAILSLAIFGGAGRRFDPWRAGLVLVFTALTLQSVRHQAEFALVAPVVLGEVLLERWPSFGNVPRIRAGAFASNAHLITAVTLAYMAFAFVTARGVQTSHEPKTNLPALSFPVGGTAFVAERYPNARMFNEYAWGGYLIDELYPHQQVFVDGRADLYGKVILADYQKVHLLKTGWDEVLDRYGIDLVIYERESSLASILRVDPRWQEVFTGPVESVFVRISKSSTVAQ